MNYRINILPEFAKNLKRLSKKYRSIKQDYADFIKELAINPQAGVEIGIGLRKLRMAIASKGKGKSHGARVITYTVILSVDEGEINLLTIYDKAERENISRKEIEDILKEL